MRATSGRRSVSRRAFVRGLAVGGVLVAAPDLWVQPAVAGTADPEQLHLQFGSDASREVVVSWATPVQVRRPRLRLGLADRSFGRTVPAETRTYVDAKSGQEIITHHARLGRAGAEHRLHVRGPARRRSKAGGQLEFGKSRDAGRVGASCRSVLPASSSPPNATVLTVEVARNMPVGPAGARSPRTRPQPSVATAGQPM